MANRGLHSADPRFYHTLRNGNPVQFILPTGYACFSAGYDQGSCRSWSPGLRPAIVSKMMRGTDQQFTQDIKFMNDIAMGIVQDKRANPSGKNNLLSAMLNGRDPKTGEKMPDASIANNMITLLIAGHETTSGLLSYIAYRLMANPEVQRKAQKEVDEVIGDGPCDIQAHVSAAIYRGFDEVH